jgi:hypothetical protein
MRNSRKGLSDDARSMSVLMGRANDLDKFQRKCKLMIIINNDKNVITYRLECTIAFIQ